MTNQTTSKQVPTDTHDGTVNGLHMETLQGTVTAIEQDPDLGQCKFRARNTWLGGNHNSTTITGFYGAKQEIAHKQVFELHADEPPILAGDDEGEVPNILSDSRSSSPKHLLDSIKVAANARDVACQSLIKVWLQEKIAWRLSREGCQHNSP
jgi:hypothetical protein